MAPAPPADPGTGWGPAYAGPHLPRRRKSGAAGKDRRPIRDDSGRTSPRRLAGFGPRLPRSAERGDRARRTTGGSLGDGLSESPRGPSDPRTDVLLAPAKPACHGSDRPRTRRLPLPKLSVRRDGAGHRHARLG